MTETEKTLKILNLYAGIGGNRKLWDNIGFPIEVTAVEIDPKIAKIYQDFFPNDKVIVADAHQFLLEHFKEFDFIWSSPPCPTHSRMSIMGMRNGNKKARYFDMRLYQEIVLLKSFFNGKWCVENVVSYYKPLIKPTCISDQYFWCNFFLGKFQDDRKRLVKHGETILGLNIKVIQEHLGISLDKHKVCNKRLLLNNAVYPKLGLHIFKMAFKDRQKTLSDL
jgi:DNA (cytosine-5)-methyltransferase 1